MRIAIRTLLRVRTLDCFPTTEHLAGENCTIAREKKGRLRDSLQSSDAYSAKACKPPDRQPVALVASYGLLFTAQPEAPAFLLAGASGWAINNNESKNTLTPATPATQSCSPLRGRSSNHSPALILLRLRFDRSRGSASKADSASILIRQEDG